MSLIERAVARLTEVKTQPGASQNPPDADAAPAERKTSIETLADRLADAALRTPAIAVPPVVDAAPASFDKPASTSPTVAAPAAIAPAAAAPTATPAPEAVRIHLEALRARGMVVPNGPTTQTGQELRVIKLAMSIAAERDHGVILIDADVARPSIPRELGIHVDKGLMDWLVDGKPDLSQLVLPTNVDTLSILPSGRRHEQATELLASEAMGRLLDQLNERYPDRIFIFDSPPLLVTTEARVLASHMGQIMMVVEAGKTPQDSVSQALSTIESNEIVGLVLNKAHNIETSGYYQGYGYGYGSA